MRTNDNPIEIQSFESVAQVHLYYKRPSPLRTGALASNRAIEFLADPRVHQRTHSESGGFPKPRDKEKSEIIKI